MKRFRKNNLELELIRELSEIDFYNISAPLNSKEFWKEWQEKFNRANLTRIALRNILRNKRLSPKEYRKVKNSIKKYEDIINYLNALKLTALNARGSFGGYFIEFDEDEEENEGGT
ncbi:hypothetical protein [Aquifex aeolicus]|uniref:Uncharacterized protein aq_420 n=1 Tax=Aquifex aeolicus (strain VF5) TaxID=224324 RepID=Y420_AQUAE|nr:hypothetical protein [Aquifex aeolicus]O66736.1 RecName: Full=Uncharacterized protein aq_420 [Aquifex aeolicus VF5]AAC06699.1 putative protein [Aquifex aeolicus VF5]